jgi:inositol-pentakisphosphate 2-kinase
MAPGDHPILPNDAVAKYLAEGAANIVYRLCVPPGTPLQCSLEIYGDGTPPPSEIDPDPLYLSAFENKLLRLRKNLPTTAQCEVAQDAWMRLIYPMFPDDQIVDQRLVELRPSGIIKKLNQELEGWERPDGIKGSCREPDLRPTRRHGIYLADDEHGLLITDMTPGALGEQVIEFKPKWLLQSPNAPSGSKRCRTCARLARINAERARLNEKPIPGICPLDLLSKDRRTILMVTRQLLAPEYDENNILRFAAWLETNTVLPHLKFMQQLMDHKGVLSNDPNNENFLVGMTLRDCTVFVRFPAKEGDPIEARIGDLDLKSPLKAEHWKRVERSLIDEGWYMGIEKENWQPLVCSLSHKRWRDASGARRNSAPE